METPLRIPDLADVGLECIKMAYKGQTSDHLRVWELSENGGDGIII